MGEPSCIRSGVAAVDSYSDFVNPAQDCILETSPYGMVWPSVKTIELGERQIRIRFELYHDRVIRMDADSHDGAAYSYDGHSIGHWEGDVLVVDTTHFEAHRNGLGGGLASSRERHLLEWFALSQDRMHMTYEFRVEDPQYLAEPMMGTLQQQYRPDLEPLDLDCDAGAAHRYLDDGR